jgi:hypothetical protein
VLSIEARQLYEKSYRERGLKMNNLEVRWCTSNEPHFGHQFVLHQSEQRFQCPGLFPIGSEDDKL